VTLLEVCLNVAAVAATVAFVFGCVALAVTAVRDLL
jgi:hypothetical protein